METNRNLEFLETQTVEQFKAEQRVDKIKVKQGENGLFFTFGAKTGAVARKGIPAHPMISKVKGEPTDRNPDGVFYLLHEEGQGGAPTIAEF